MAKQPGERLCTQAHCQHPPVGGSQGRNSDQQRGRGGIAPCPSETTGQIGASWPWKYFHPLQMLIITPKTSQIPKSRSVLWTRQSSSLASRGPAHGIRLSDINIPPFLLRKSSQQFPLLLMLKTFSTQRKNLPEKGYFGESSLDHIPRERQRLWQCLRGLLDMQLLPHTYGPR